MTTIEDVPTTTVVEDSPTSTSVEVEPFLGQLEVALADARQAAAAAIDRADALRDLWGRAIALYQPDGHAVTLDAVTAAADAEGEEARARLTAVLLRIATDEPALVHTPTA